MYNEARNIQAVTDELLQVLDSLPSTSEILLCDDGSTDDTLSQALAMCRNYSNVRVLTSPSNQGQSIAWIAGINLARGDLIAFVDADGQTPAANLLQLLEQLRPELIFSKGFRQIRYDNFLIRVIPSKIGNYFLSRLSGVPIRDLGCSLGVYRRQALLDTPFFPNFHRYLAILLAWQNLPFVEIPVTHKPRSIGNSRYNIFRKWITAIPEFLLIRKAYRLDTQSTVKIRQVQHNFKEVYL